MNKIKDDILSYREMCDIENVQTLQRGMNFRMKPSYSVILMSQRSNAPYNDKIHDDGITIEYEGHDTTKKSYEHNPKSEDQPEKLPTGNLTQNGLFIKAVLESLKFSQNTLASYLPKLKKRFGNEMVVNALCAGILKIFTLIMIYRSQKVAQA